MRVTVKLHATLRKYLPPQSNDNAIVLEVPAETTVADVLARLSIPSDHAKMIVAGGEHLQPTSVLHDGQEINLFPPLAGGL